MRYGVADLSRLAGISVRTLHYYDEIGLLSPEGRGENNYRFYGRNEVDLLQQILFYRELGVGLEEIKRIMTSDGYDGLVALESHLKVLKGRRNQIDKLIDNLEHTIDAFKGKRTMKDNEKFEGFKKNLIDENEEKYGKEVREKFGHEAVDEGNARVMGLTEEEYKKVEKLSKKINESLAEAFRQGDPAGDLAQEVCALHKEWLGYYWKDYTKEAHLAMAENYVEDPRFRAYYDSLGEGCAEFLRDALKIYCR